MKKKIQINKKLIIYTQVFWLIFFAELGDKSQLSTILLAAREVNFETFEFKFLKLKLQLSVIH